MWPYLLSFRVLQTTEQDPLFVVILNYNPYTFYLSHIIVSIQSLLISIYHVLA